MTECGVTRRHEPVSMTVAVTWFSGIWMPDQVRHDMVWWGYLLLACFKRLPSPVQHLPVYLSCLMKASDSRMAFSIAPMSC
jgi:hypothetical protein